MLTLRSLFLELLMYRVLIMFYLKLKRNCMTKKL